MGRVSRYAGGFINETQAEGASFLYRGIPRSFLYILGLFLVIYAGYWACILLGVPGDATQWLVYALGLLTGIVFAITLLKLWPRLEPALPRWFRNDTEGPALHKHHKYLTWAGLVLLVAVCAVGITVLIFGAVMIMGLVGGIYILFRTEDYILRNMDRAKRLLPWFWAGSGWRIFFTLFAGFLLLIVVVTVVAVAVGSNEVDGTHELKFAETLVVLVPIIALCIQTMVLGVFFLLQLWRAWMRRRVRKGALYGRRRSALVRAHPASLAYYLLGVNYSTGSFFFAYAVLVVLQSIAEARSQGVNIPIDVSGVLMPGELLDYIALATFAIAWVALLLNLSGTAVRGGRRILNRNVFASLSVFFLMVLFMHVVVANGDEFRISIAFRGAYMIGLALAPALIFWRRWKTVAGHEVRAGEVMDAPGPAPPPPLSPF